MPRPGTIATALVVVAATCGVLPPLSGSARAQTGGAPPVSVDVEVDRRTISVDDDLEVTFTLSGSYDGYREPTFDGFEIVGRRHAEQMSFSSGRLTRSKSLVYRLQPTRAGTLFVEPLEATSGGQVVGRSERVAITVRGVKPAPPTPADRRPEPEDKASQAIFLQTTLERDVYYVGEVFTVGWQLYFRPTVAVQAVESVSAPRMEGVLAEELLAADRQPRPRETTVRGRRFRFFPQSVQLVTGLRPGKITIDPMTIRVSVGQFFSQKRYTVRSEPLILDVRPLPEEGRPASFRDGNVGHFQLSGSLRNADGAAPERVQTGERLILELVVSGDGNLVSAKPPVLTGAEGRFEVQALPSTAEDVIEKDAAGMHGKRVFQYLVSPLAPGEQLTPAAELAFFDPAAGRYRTLTVPGTEITVVGRAVPEGGGIAALAGDDIGPHIDAHTLSPGGGGGGAPLFWALLAFPLLAYLSAEGRHWLAAARARDPQGRRSRTAYANARKRLSLAEQVLREGLVKDFYGHLSRAITAYFEERANLPATGMTHDELRSAATERGYPVADADAAIVELENCDFARFAPAASAEQQMRDSLERARALIKRLDAVEPQRSS